MPAANKDCDNGGDEQSPRDPSGEALEQNETADKARHLPPGPAEPDEGGSAEVEAVDESGLHDLAAAPDAGTG